MSILCLTSYLIVSSCLQVFNEHPSRIISLEMIARLVSEAEDSLKLEQQVAASPPRCTGSTPAKKKDEDRREGNGRRCCLGGRIDSIPCHARYFEPGRIEEKDELH